MSQVSEIKGQLNEIFADIFDDEDIVISEDMTADDVEDWDSLAHVRLIVAIENEFGIEFTASEIEGFTDVGEMIKAITSKIG